MSLGSRIVAGSVSRYKAVTAVMAAAALVIASAAVLPSVFPRGLGFLHPIEVDTDPENMLSASEPVRMFHDRMKRELDLHDMVVVGVVNDEHPDGVFNPSSLRKVHELTEYAGTLNGPAIGEPAGEGVIARDIIAPSTVDNIEPSAGGISFSWLMPAPPETPEAARKIRRSARRIPLLNGTMVADKPGREGKAVAIYLPLTRKDLSYKVYSRLRERIPQLEGDGPERFYITGLPVAEDTFGVEMFVQMALSAPAAMLVIFVLMLVFFRKLVVVIAPMIVALASVIFTMGALVIAGFPIHIMSSMIPIFIMPIAVLDSVHIISEFFERYQGTRDRRKTILSVMDDLFMPMLYTSLTSTAGFASLALTPIPPVQVFGVFVAAGIMVAWLLTVTFIPAYVMFISPKTLANFGAKHAAGEAEDRTAMGRALRWLAGATFRRARPILAVSMLVLAVAIYGISRININDNPVKWFTPSHPIREADTVLNQHFGGTYMAYLAMETDEPPFDPNAFAAELVRRAEQKARESGGSVAAMFGGRSLEALARAAAWTRPDSAEKMLTLMKTIGEQSLRRPPARGKPSPTPAPPSTDDEPPLPAGAGDEPALPAIGKGPAEKPDKDASAIARQEAWERLDLFLAEQRMEREVFKRPDVLRWMVRLQERMKATGIVGKSNSLADIVRTVHRDFVSGEEDDYRIPDSRPAVGQMLIQYQNSHRPGDLWHFATPDYRLGSIWVQMTSGDNQDMQDVVDGVKNFIGRQGNAPPVPMRLRWFGLTYINVKWQEKMVTGMLEAFAGSFLVVLLLMVILFRSVLWGLLSMIPLTVTITAIYGAVGLVGKDYDMPVAVLSSLTLGLAVDFAIHFLARSRAMYLVGEATWEATVPSVFGEPARAITRNIILIAAGFLPLLLAPLVPYKTVGVLLAVILLVSGVATLLILPALVRLLERWLFVTAKAPMPARCNCGLCVVSAVTLVALIAMGIRAYVPWHWTTLTWAAAAVIPVAALICGLSSRRRKCELQQEREEQ